MSSQAAGENISHTKRFIDRHARKVDIPYSEFLDAKFHPKLKDHLVVLSRNVVNKKQHIQYMGEVGENNKSNEDKAK